MQTTSLKLPGELKQRAAAAAQGLGKTPHAFMVEAIEQAAALAESRAKFLAEAETARQSLLKDGKGFDADEVHDYLRKRIKDKQATRPQAKDWQS